MRVLPCFLFFDDIDHVFANGCHVRKSCGNELVGVAVVVVAANFKVEGSLVVDVAQSLCNFTPIHRLVKVKGSAVVVAFTVNLVRVNELYLLSQLAQSAGRYPHLFNYP